MEHPIYKWMIWGYPYFRKPPYLHPTKIGDTSGHLCAVPHHGWSWDPSRGESAEASVCWCQEWGLKMSKVLRCCKIRLASYTMLYSRAPVWFEDGKCLEHTLKISWVEWALSVVNFTFPNCFMFLLKKALGGSCSEHPYPYGSYFLGSSDEKWINWKMTTALMQNSPT